MRLTVDGRHRYRLRVSDPAGLNLTLVKSA
jgi:hypothetical protein